MTDVSDTGTLVTRLSQTPDQADLVHETAAPRRIGRYVVQRKLSEGGMGVIYIARDDDLDRDVAVKLIRPRLSGAAQEQAHSRMIREAQALARLSHANVVQVHEVGEVDGRVFIAMELVQGDTLRDWLGRRGRSQKDILDVFVQAGRGLAAAHAAGIVHRDFKPENVVVGQDRVVKVLDFGLARPDTTPHPDDTTTLSSSSRPTHWRALDITAAEHVTGTPAYMSPEQFARTPGDPRSDQFSFCVALYEALYGTRPFVGRTFKELALAVTQGRMRPPSPAARVPRWLHAAVLRGLATDPAARWPTLDPLLAELTRDHEVPWARIGLAVFGATGLAVGLAAAAGLLSAAPQPCTGADDELAAAWNDDRRAAVRDAFAATALPYAAEAAERALSRIDAHAAAWAGQAVDACAATRLRGEASEDMLDRRNACLHRRLDALAALVDVFARADATVVERSDRAVAELEPLAPCASEAYLLADVEPPADPAVTAAVAELRPQLARVESLLYTSDLTVARAAAESTWLAARAIDYPPIQAEAAYWRARVSTELDPDQSPQGLIDAYHAAFRVRHDVFALKAALALTRRATYHWLWDEADTWARHADDLLTRSPDPSPQDVARMTMLQAEILGGRSRYPEALAASERAVRLAEALGPSGGYYMVSALRILGETQVELGHPRDGLATFLRMRDAVREQLPETHPRVATAGLNVSVMYSALGDYEAALAELEAAVAILARGPPINESTRGTRLQNLAVIHAGLGRLDEAIAETTAALEIYERIYGDHISTAQVLNNRAVWRRLRGDPDLADSGRAVRMLEQLVGPEDPALTLVSAEHAWSLLDAGRVDEARPLAERAHRLAEQHAAGDTVPRSRALGVLGRLRLREGQPAAAADLLREAIAVQTRVDDGRAHWPDLGAARFDLARALWASGPDTRDAARAEARAAADLLARDGPRSAHLLREITAWLAAPA